jgi:hypothetical protein
MAIHSKTSALHCAEVLTGYPRFVRLATNLRQFENALERAAGTALIKELFDGSRELCSRPAREFLFCASS